MCGIRSRILCAGLAALLFVSSHSVYADTVLTEEETALLKTILTSAQSELTEVKNDLEKSETELTEARSSLEVSKTELTEVRQELNQSRLDLQTVSESLKKQRKETVKAAIIVAVVSSILGYGLGRAME